MSIRVVQCRHSDGRRIVAVVDGDSLHVVESFTSFYDLAQNAIENAVPLEAALRSAKSNAVLEYDAIYAGQSEWSLLPPFDHPADPAHCLVTGTGLSHRKSADNRNAMHTAGAVDAPVTDSMRMYQTGLNGGRPSPGEIGAAPEWFWKGDGSILCAHGEPLTVPNYAEDCGDEAEIAGVYIISIEGDVRRIGLAAANEFSDHVLESRNYLYLAPSKLRQCSLGPEILIGGEFSNIAGDATVTRGSNVVWAQDIRSGEANMVHSLNNLEHHHFKYEQHRRGGDVHIHFFGTPGFSFGSGLRLLHGDVMSVRFDGCGRTLRNPIAIDMSPQLAIEVRQA